MILRPYQEAAVSDAVKALKEKGRTMIVAPTGAGKTVMLSALIGRRYEKGKRILVIQHRDELVDQNKMKFSAVNPLITTSIVSGSYKNWDGEAVFGMVQTISRDNNLRDRPKFDMVVVDESHHAAATTYRKVIDAVREDNPKAEIVGFTATPNRGDGKGLRDVFGNCCHKIELGTLIREGYLVRPKTFVIDLGVGNDLQNVTKRGKEYDMEEVAAIMDRRVVNERVVREWMEKAGDRKTVVFCSTVAHAEHLCQSFVDAGIKADFVTGETESRRREQMLRDLSEGDLQVVVNVAVLTEGFDSPPVSCVVLTRPCSQKGTMVQMIGRGLRTLDPEIYKDMVKTDCIVLDFGTSVITHGSLDDAVNLDGTKRENSGAEAPTKTCPDCEAEVAVNIRVCPFCEHVFESKEKSDLIEFEMTEYDIMKLSPFMWIDPFGDSNVMMAMGFEGFAFTAHIKDDMWVSIVKRNKRGIRTVSIGNKANAMAAADDFLREIETDNSANKSKRWLSQPASEKQKQHLRRAGFEIGITDFSWTKYRAACTLSFQWNRKSIEDAFYEAQRRVSA